MFPTNSMPALDIHDYANHALTRNRGLITPEEQAALGAATILIAGCGSVGGSALEPLVRLGAMRLRLADPDVYELSNINRQLCTLEDLGKTKGSVLANRARAINPYVEAQVYDDGLTEENLGEALTGVSIVFDGIDPEESGWVKYLLHARSAERGIPVVAGYDFGGKPTLYVFDYRRDRRPFFGKTTEAAHREGRYRDAMRWLGYFHFPVDFLPIMRRGLRDGGVWPQVAYCVQGLGAITSRVIIDLLMARPVRRVVSTDLHRLARPYPQAIASNLRLPAEMLSTLVVANRYAGRGRPATATEIAVPDHLELPPELASALEGARLAPSRFNSQPWLFHIVSANTVRVGWSSDRLLAASDPQRRLSTYALGCAIEAIDYLAECEWREPAADAPQDASWSAGELTMGALRERELLVRRAVLGARATNRGKYLCDGVDVRLLGSAQRAAAEYGVSLQIIDQRTVIDRVSAVVAAAVGNALADEAQLEEIWHGAPGRQGLVEIVPGGSACARTLLARTGRTLLARTGATPALRRHVLTLGLGSLLSRHARESIRNSAALLIFTTAADDPPARVRAGRALMRTWLMLTEAGYAAAPQQASLADPADVARTREAARIDDGQTLATILRVGRGLTARSPSPRLPLASLIGASQRSVQPAAHPTGARV
jgi:molybdopterin/thiamine biosynthesis adenylyltransferase